MKEKIQAYRPAVAAFLTMMAMSITTSILSFFLEPICGALEIGRGTFSVLFSLMSITGALVTPFLGPYMGKHGVRGILFMGGIWSGGCMILLSLVRNLGMLYGLGLMIGIFSSNCLALCANMIVQQNYSGAKASGILGTVMAGSGVGGMVFSLLIPRCIAWFGWRWGAVAMGGSWWAVLWLAAVLLGKEEKKGFGGTVGSQGQGVTRSEALKSRALYLMMGIIIIVCACCGVQQQLPSMLSAYHFPEAKVSVMISASTAFLAVGKVLQGLVYGKLGLARGGTLMMGAFAGGMLLMLSPSLVWIGLLLLPLGFGVYTTLMSQVTRQIFGTREYAAIWSWITAAGSVGTILANPIWGTIYDVTGSYALGLVAAAVLLLAAIAAMLLALKKT